MRKAVITSLLCWCTVDEQGFAALYKSHYFSNVSLLEPLWKDKIIQPVKMEKCLFAVHDVKYIYIFLSSHMTMGSFKLYELYDTGCLSLSFNLQN